jgi:hypothetical protein
MKKSKVTASRAWKKGLVPPAYRRILFFTHYHWLRYGVGPSWKMLAVVGEWSDLSPERQRKKIMRAHLYGLVWTREAGSTRVASSVLGFVEPTAKQIMEKISDEQKV